MSEAEQVMEWRLLALSLTRGLFLPGGDRDDLDQEAMIGLLTALRTHDPVRGPLRSHVIRCVLGRLHDRVKVANSLRQRSLNEAAVMGTGERGELVELVDMLPARDADPVIALECREELARIGRGLAACTREERRCLVAVAFCGTPYDRLGRRKAVDNAVQRARMKLRAAA